MSIEHVLDLIHGSIEAPNSARDMASTLLIDTIGVAAGAANFEVAHIVKDHAIRFHSAPNQRDMATILFDGRKASIPGAAFAAASQIDNLDAHDGYNRNKGHIGCAVVPALCAFAEANPNLSARDAIDALIVSYEVAARAGTALHKTVADYHTSGAWNALGVVALGARMRGLTRNQTRHALGIAEYHGPRSQMMREIANPTMLHDGSGMGAFVGTMAVLLGESGFEGAPAITIEDNAVAEYWSDLGTRWTVGENYIKPYPICRWAHAAVDALGILIDEHGLLAEEVADIQVNTFTESAELFAGAPRTTSEAQYALAYPLAVRIIHGRIGPEHVQEPVLSEPEVLKIIPKIRATTDPRHSARFPEGRWSDVLVRTTDGRTLSSGDVNARGGPENPLPLPDVREKFHSMAGALPDARRNAIWGMRDRLNSHDVPFKELLDMIHLAPSQRNRASESILGA